MTWPYCGQRRTVRGPQARCLVVDPSPLPREEPFRPAHALPRPGEEAASLEEARVRCPRLRSRGRCACWRPTCPRPASRSRQPGGDPTAAAWSCVPSCARGAGRSRRPRRRRPTRPSSGRPSWPACRGTCSRPARRPRHRGPAGGVWTAGSSPTRGRQLLARGTRDRDGGSRGSCRPARSTSCGWSPTGTRTRRSARR